MKHISKAALSLLLMTSINQGAAFADDKLTAELLRRVEALEKRASLADKLESENRQLRAKLEKTSSVSEKGRGKLAVSSASRPSTGYTRYNDSSTTEMLSGPASYGKQSKAKQWQGVYAGFNAGYSQNMIGYTGYDTNFYAPSYGVGYITQYTSTGLFSGPVVGGQVGYNYQFANNIVLGVELDLDYADVRDTNTNSLGGGLGKGGLFGVNGNSLTYDPSNGGLYGNTQYTRVGLNWIGTVRARLGYSLENFLPYVTGGLAYGGLSGEINNSYAYSTIGDSSYMNFEHGTNSIIQPGWVLGAGAEYMVADGWSVKGEYLFTQISGITIRTTGASANSYSSYLYSESFGANLATNAFGIHQARIGLNYHTDWLSSNAAAADKY